MAKFQEERVFSVDHLEKLMATMGKVNKIKTTQAMDDYCNLYKRRPKKVDFRYRFLFQTSVQTAINSPVLVLLILRLTNLQIHRPFVLIQKIREMPIA